MCASASAQRELREVIGLRWFSAVDNEMLMKQRWDRGGEEIEGATDTCHPIGTTPGST